jgi:hypothetical protein
VTVTAPSGTPRFVGGQANSIGYFSGAEDDFVLDDTSDSAGTFKIGDSRLQITITKSAATSRARRIPPAAKTNVARVAPKTRAPNTWINPRGGEWSNKANWHGGVIPNGPPEQWVQYNFEKPRRVSGVEVYWLDDNGGVRVPDSWRVLHRQTGRWQPVETADKYGVAEDRFNEVRFKPLETDTLRLEVKLQPGHSGGILEWRVNP